MAALNSLTLEQVPRLRGSVMSLSQAMTGVGEVIGISLSGLIIMMYGYGPAALFVCAAGITAILLIFFVAIDPTRMPKSSTKS